MKENYKTQEKIYDAEVLESSTFDENIIIIMPADVVKKGCIDHWCGSLPQSCPARTRFL